MACVYASAGKPGFNFSSAARSRRIRITWCSASLPSVPSEPNPLAIEVGCLPSERCKKLDRRLLYQGILAVGGCHIARCRCPGHTSDCFRACLTRDTSISPEMSLGEQQVASSAEVLDLALEG